MGRPVEIDRDDAFQRAYALFWDRGYRSTSLNDLLRELGVGRSSFYAAFASKEALFLDVLAKYQEQIEETFRRVRTKHQGLSALRTYLYQSGVNVSATQRRKGCLAVNTTLELAGVDDELHEKAANILGTIESILVEIFRECQQLREVDDKQPPELLARMFWIALQGLHVAFRQGLNRSDAAKSVDSLLDLYAR